MKRARPSIQERMQEHQPVEADLVYWLEHVVHWHALLFAVVTALSLGYVLFGGNYVWAG